MSDGRPTMPAPPERDRILEFLMGLRLADYDKQFRALMANVAPDKTPENSDMAITTVGLLMSLGGVNWPAVMKTISLLSKLSYEELSEGAVGVVNGAHLVVPGGNDQVHAYDLESLQSVDISVCYPALVSSIYSMSAICEKTEELLR